MRPWEWPDIDAYDWNLTTSVQNAVKEGVAEYHKHKADDAGADDLRLKLIQKHQSKTG